MHVSGGTERHLNNGSVPIRNSQRENENRITQSRESVQVEPIPFNTAGL